MNIRSIVSIVLVLLLCCSCKPHKELTQSGLNIRDYQTEVDRQLTNLFVLKNHKGMEVCVTNFGARVVSIMVPDKNGKMEDVVTGFPTINEYMAKKQNFGATIGRYIGRILNATFTLDSITYQLTPTGGGHISHGGSTGFANQIWQAEQLDENSLKLSLHSPDGASGFPGNLSVHLIYSVTDDNELDIQYQAETDRATVVNLSHHSFFNISGDFNKTVEDQLLYINAQAYIPYDSLKCVTGEILPVIDTPFDFTTPRLIGERIDEDNMQLKVTGGYDHSWVLDTHEDDTQLAARLIDTKSGRTLEVYTNEPGLHVYSANGLSGKLVGKKGIAYATRTSICFETLHFADSPNKPQFPSTVLRPGEVYKSRCIYRFGVVDH